MTELGRALTLFRFGRKEALYVMTRRLGYTSAYLSAIENGKAEIPHDFMRRLQSAYNLNIQKMLEFQTANVLDSLSRKKELIISGIGSRSMQDNPAASALFRKIFNAFDNLNSDNLKIILRSGGAEGADSIAEHSFSGEKQIILPWKGFNGEHIGEIIYSDDKEASDLVNQTHPAPEKLSQGARKCLERDIWQILGPPDEKPRRKTDVVICWKEPNRTGGTAFTTEIAEKFGVPVFNVAENDELEMLRVLFKDLKNATQFFYKR